jgi:hypothetical protein
MKTNATIGGCVNTTLVNDAIQAGKRYRNAILRGDFNDAEHAWNTGYHNVGYPYMSTSDYAAAKAAFIAATKGTK